MSSWQHHDTVILTHPQSLSVLHQQLIIFCVSPSHCINRHISCLDGVFCDCCIVFSNDLRKNWEHITYFIIIEHVEMTWFPLVCRECVFFLNQLRDSFEVHTTQFLFVISSAIRPRVSAVHMRTTCSPTPYCLYRLQIQYHLSIDIFTR